MLPKERTQATWFNKNHQDILDDEMNFFKFRNKNTVKLFFSGEMHPYLYGIVFLSLGFAFSVLYRYGCEIKSSNPDHVTTFNDCVYFSFITFCTVGYGDFTPATAFSKFATYCQAIFGVVNAGLFINSIFRNHSKNEEVVRAQKISKEKHQIKATLERHMAILVEALESGNQFIWDKHPIHSKSIAEQRGYIDKVIQQIHSNIQFLKFLNIKALLETANQKYDLLLAVTPLSIQISSEYFNLWASAMANIRRLSDIHHDYWEADPGNRGAFPNQDDVQLQIAELFQTMRLLSVCEIS